MKIGRESFVLFKLPNEYNSQLWILNSINKNKGKFVFNSFDDSIQFNLFAQNKYVFELDNLNDLSLEINLKSDEYIPKSLTKDEYIKKAENFIQKINNHVFDKIILSRVKIQDKVSDIITWYHDLCLKYPSAWVYLFHHKDETWIGASPERLLYDFRDKYMTVALAGTKSKLDNREWTDKEYNEHDYVVKYILSKFEDNSIEKNGPYTVDLREIQHLKTDINISKSENNLGEILNSLHPTPAVCGIPKDESKKYIIENEGYDRSFYTGYFGIESTEHTEFYVNLRCAQLFQNYAAIYVGGGLVSSSTAISEWEETELKSKALF